MKKYMNKGLTFIILLFLVFTFVGCKEKDYYYYPLQLDDSFNTTNTVTVFSLIKKSDEEITNLTDELNAILVNLDNLFNVQDRNDDFETELMKINNNAGIVPVNVSDEVIYVLEEAIKLSQITEIDDKALFDPTIAPIWMLWDFVNNLYNPFEPLDTVAEAPQREKIEELLPLVDYKNIEINKENKTVYLKKAGMKIDLGAIVKGYAADKLKNHLISKGYSKAVIDVGRNIQTIGSYFDKDLQDQPWVVKIQTPYVNFTDDDYENNKFYGTVYVNDVTVVTSGTYEKYIKDEEGNEYHHILDPRNGYPFDNNVLSVTVVTKLSILGDGYSTSLFSLGLEEGMKLVNKTDFLETVWVVKNEDKYEVYISSGLKDTFVFNTHVENLGYVFKGVYNESTSN